MSATSTGSGITTSASQEQPSTPGPSTIAASNSPAERPRTPTPGLSPTAATVHEADNGRTFMVHVGQELNVALPGGSSGGYHLPDSSSSALVRFSATGGYPSSRPVSATFHGVHTGRSQLTSQTDFTCLHSTGPHCLPPQRQWTVTVNIT